MTNLNKVLLAVTNTLSPKRIVLFGSRSKNKNKKNSDIDLAVIQNESPKVGQRAKIFRKLVDMNYDWKVEPDIHIFSEKSFEQRLKNNSFFVREILKGKVLYAS